MERNERLTKADLAYFALNVRYEPDQRVSSFAAFPPSQRFIVFYYRKN